jgi:hypothetical protein
MAALPYVSCANKKTEEIVMAKNKHLTDAERLQIEQWLKDRVSIKQIALKLGKAICLQRLYGRVSMCTTEKVLLHRRPMRPTVKC